MLEIYWNKETGWEKPQIVPFHNLELSPFNSTLHYALGCFEGLKAYKDAQGKIRLFRPDRNIARLQSSFERLAFPVKYFFLSVSLIPLRLLIKPS